MNAQKRTSELDEYRQTDKGNNTRAATTAAILAIPYYEINPRKVGKNSKLSAKNISPRVDRKKQILG